MQNDPILTPIFAAALVSAGLPTAITVGAASISIASVLSAATMVAGAVALSYSMQPEAPKPEQGTIPLRQSIPPRFAGFGEVRLAGAYACYELSGPHSFDVFALCQGPAGGFKQIYLDDAKVTINPTTGACAIGPVDGTLEGAGAYASCSVGARRGSKLETQMLPLGGIPLTAAFNAVWTANHRGDRIVKCSLTAGHVASAGFLSAFPHGLPKLSAAIFLPCWDFRDPLQNPDDPDTWVNYPLWNSGNTYPAGARVLYGGIVLPGVAAGGMAYLCIANAPAGIAPDNVSGPAFWAPIWKNPVLQAVTYLTNPDIGMGLPRERIITPSLTALTQAAAICDEPVLLEGGAAYETRYPASPWFKLETEPVEVLGLIMGACDGWLSLNGDGALAVKVGKFEPPTVILDESDIVSVDLSYGVPDESKVDELQLTFTSPAFGYTTQSADPWRDEAAILNRGGKVRSNAFGPASVQSPTQVRRLAKRIFLRTNAMRGTIVTTLAGMKCAGQRYVQVRFPLIPELQNTVVELRRRETDIAQRQCRFEFVLVDEELLDGWVPEEEEGEPPPPPVVLPPAPGLPVPQNVVAMPVTGPPYLIDVSWDDPEFPSLSYMVRWRVAESPGGPFMQMQFDDVADLGARLAVTLPGATAGVPYEIQVASMGAGGTLSAWSDPAYVGTPEFDYPSLDYSDGKNSSKWLWANTF